MPPDQTWDADVAARYDTPGTGMFDPVLLRSTTQRLTDLADGGSVLEFAIGTGRVAIPLQESGVRVTGIELSQPMVDQLRAKVDEATIPVVVGDMATTHVDGDFTLVYLVFNTVSNLLSQAEQVRCFHNAAGHLRPGGRFVIELWVPDLRVLPPGQVGTVDRVENGYLVVDTYDVLNQGVVSHHVRFPPGGPASVFLSAHRYIWPAELDLMAQLAGFALESRHADWDGTPFTAESGSHVSVYRLPLDS